MHSQNLTLITMLTIAAFNGGCKTTRNSSVTKETTPFSQTNVVDLTRYKDADQATFQDMKDEMKANNFNYDQLRKKIDALPTVPAGVDKDELVAIRLYTSSAYRKVNQALRTRDPATLPAMESIIKAASSGLNKLPASPCTAKRGTGLPDNVLKALEKDTQFIECAFLSTTYGDIPGAFKKDITFEIESDSCARIDWMSEFPNEKEVLFPPGSEFFVTDRTDEQKNGKTLTTLKMKHVMSGDPALNQAKRKIDCMNITDLPGSPGTGGVTPVSVANLTKRTFVSETTGLRIQFADNGSAERRNGPQRSSCSWVYNQNKFTVTCGSETQYYFAFSADRIGLMAGAGSDQISEYLSAQ
jgi:hypothetical protein